MEQNTYIQEDEITLKELILKIKEYAMEVLRLWYVVVLFTLPIAGYFIYKNTITKPIYKSETRFIVEGSSGGGGGISSLLGQFGIRGNSKTNPYKIQEVAKSTNLVQRVIFQKVNDTLIANRIIAAYDFHKAWEKSKREDIKGFYFKNTDASQFNDTENIALKSVLGKIIGGPKIKDQLLSVSFDEDSGIYSLSINSVDEQLTIALNKLLYIEVKDFFENEILEGQSSTLKILKAKADSLQAVINSKTYAAASAKDKTLGLVTVTPSVRGEKAQREAFMLTEALGEVVKSYEIADINYRDTRPMFMAIGETIPPLEAAKQSRIIAIIIGIGLGGLIGVAFILGRKIVLDAMK